MARVDEDTVAHVARLAHLSLTDAERAMFTRQLEQILDHAAALESVDLSGLEPARHGLPGALREDEPRPPLPREEALAGAPDVDAGLFRVPRILG